MTTHLDVGDPLLSRILGRERSLFTEDLACARASLVDAIRGRRILVVGASGSIGGAFVRQLAGYAPQALHLVDLNENTLVELVRDLRSSPLKLPDDFQTVSVDFGSVEFERFATLAGPYDVFVNFSAMKHVRSERDVYSLMRLLDVNIRALASFLARPAASKLERAFSVSTDKSVRPVNLMGASKNLMERVLFRHGSRVTTTSARFANVAFSAGSLLEGFESRLAKRQAIAAPTDVRRYFISHEEAGQLCLLACFSGASREVFFPKLTAERDLLGMADIATLFLRHHGYEPLPCASEEEARTLSHFPPGRWPCWFSPSDTTGEKPYEEFCRDDDNVDSGRYPSIAVVKESPPDESVLDTFLAELARMRQSRSWNKADVVDLIRVAVPELQHQELGRSLDLKM